MFAENPDEDVPHDGDLWDSQESDGPPVVKRRSQKEELKIPAPVKDEQMEENLSADED